MDWAKEREIAVKNAKQNYPTFNEDSDFLCLLYVHKFQALSKVLSLTVIYAAWSL
jgi:hypothetical protein